MNTHNVSEVGGQTAGRKYVMHTVLAMLVAAIGIAVLIYMIVVEDEPGALPMALIALGVGWFIFARMRLRPPPRAQ